MAKRRRVKTKIVETFDLSPELVMDLPRITMIGNGQLFIENHKGITLYDKDCIRIMIGQGQLIVEGEELNLRTVYTDDIYIQGRVKGIVIEGSM